MSQYLVTHNGAAFSVMPSSLGSGLVYFGLTDQDEDAAGTSMTPDEARGLAQRLLKEAAEVEFAGKCVAASEGGGA